jgi:hypothetical protein
MDPMTNRVATVLIGLAVLAVGSLLCGNRSRAQERTKSGLAEVASRAMT